MLELPEAPWVRRLIGKPFFELARVRERHEFLRAAAEHFGARIAEHRLGALGKIRVAPLRIGFPDELAGGFHHVAEALLAVRERALGALAVAYVGHHPAHAERAAVGRP